ncbi:RNA polymerase sigma-70 factor (ECF subfamily) [Actimicrobium sp. GrIS 1.19]|uniref:sigma-70 family RNA polymerase sigma factor n=1 Tax=Actimicrobium sp. GrIS 1.19 TaxID=3071708 RepID=UPI002E0972A1|nr:RNA polymerase sigma-70 factor (ECF subfamily) [Actimicrobium sp. GrIS 1.19]
MRDVEFDYEAALFACARGEQAALRRLYEREARWLMAVALRIVRRNELADEVLHDAFLRIWQKAASYSPVLGSARGWIYSVVRYRALDVARAHRHEAAAPDTVPDELVAEDADPLDHLTRERAASALHDCLAHLDESKRACILLAYQDGYSQTEIASTLARPLGTIKAWTRRGLLALKECLS